MWWMVLVERSVLHMLVARGWIECMVDERSLPVGIAVQSPTAIGSLSSFLSLHLPRREWRENAVATASVRTTVAVQSRTSGCFLLIRV